MIVQINADGFIESYATIGNLDGGVTTADPADMDHFEANFNAYRLDGDLLVFDGAVQEEQRHVEAVAAYRIRREGECFAIINRGGLWYDTLTTMQREELRQWYCSWLDGTDNLAVPEKPTWLI